MLLAFECWGGSGISWFIGPFLNFYCQITPRLQAVRPAGRFRKHAVALRARGDHTRYRKDRTDDLDQQPENDLPDLSGRAWYPDFMPEEQRDTGNDMDGTGSYRPVSSSASAWDCLQGTRVQVS